MSCSYVEDNLLMYTIDAIVIDSAKNIAALRNISIILCIVVACILNAVDRRVIPGGL
jgi:hypothetical protein